MKKQSVLHRLVVDSATKGKRCCYHSMSMEPTEIEDALIFSFLVASDMGCIQANITELSLWQLLLCANTCHGHG